MTEIDDEEYFNTIEKLVLKKAKFLNEKNIFIKKKKVLNFLLQKGYEFKDVIDIVNTIV